MNKLLVSDIIDLETGDYLLETKSDKVIINSKGTIKIYLVNAQFKELDLNIYEKSIVYIYNFNKFNNTNKIITINQENDSKIYYNESLLTDFDSNLVINNNINGNNNESYINIRNISNAQLSKIIINVEVVKNTVNNIAIEDLKGINNGGFIHIEPNIVALSNELSANHLTTIGGVNEEDINYLMTKGISKEKGIEILLKGFILGNMDNYIQQLITIN